MIPKKEILKHASKYKLPANTIEKDYVLNWLLLGISHSDELNKKWIFKGGTCLKKCFFEEYRFSEDLDFTILDKSQANIDFLIENFKSISIHLYERAGVEIPTNLIKFEEYLNPRGKYNIIGKIAYRGPLQRRTNFPTIKLDLCFDELLVNEPVSKQIHHPYSDLQFTDKRILTYSLEEIFAEKIRALAERMRPRDLYDVIHLHTDKRWQPDQKKVLSILDKKCKFKNMEMPTYEQINTSTMKADIEADWSDMLVHQIAALDSYNDYWGKLSDFFSWLYKK